MSLEARDLTLAYGSGGDPVVRGLDLRVLEGGITALVGPNGCGKSTLLRGLSRLMKPRSGGVYLDGEPLFDLSTRAVARRVGVLPQGPVAPEGLTVGELVARGRYAHQGLFQAWSEADERAAARALAITGMDEMAARPMETLSGGQRQRAWIAMVLAQETELLLLDEPTTFLDVAHQVEVLDLLVELNEEEGRTILMVLHDINQACRYADELLIMEDGRLVAQGDPSEVVTPDRIEEVFGLACRIVPDPVTGTPLCVPLPGRASPRAGTAGTDAARHSPVSGTRP